MCKDDEKSKMKKEKREMCVWEEKERWNKAKSMRTNYLRNKVKRLKTK